MKIVELPREAIQASQLVPTATKVDYINALLKVGFDTVEIGSMVSPKVIPQMADALDVVKRIDLRETKSNLMMLVVNKKGAEVISEFEEINLISFPFSISPTFLKLNLNTTPTEVNRTIDDILNICEKKNKKLVLYISHSFGNPYGDPFSHEVLYETILSMQQKGISIMPLSNISMEVGESEISELFSLVIPEFPEIEFGLHLHTTHAGCFEKIFAAWVAGCRRFDGVLNGLGGCPMTEHKLLPNLDTEHLFEFLSHVQIENTLDTKALQKARLLALQTFS